MLTLLNDRTYQVTVEKVERQGWGTVSDYSDRLGGRQDEADLPAVGGSRHGCDGIAEYSC